MSFSQAELDALNTMIASGVLRTRIDGREVEYRTMDDLIRARNEVATALAAGGGTTRQRHVYPTVRREA